MIQRTWGERFRLNRRHLKIRSVRLSDSGVIVCKGVNGFGSQSVALDLVVRGRRESTWTECSPGLKMPFRPLLYAATS